MRFNEKQAEEERKRRLIAQVYDLNKLNPKKIKELTLRDRLFLSSLIRSRMDENFNYIQKLYKHETEVSPSNEYTLEMVRSLISNSLLKVHPSSTIDCFEDKEDFPQTFFTFYVNYHINVELIHKDKKRTMEFLTYPSPDSFLIDKEFCYEMWREIALEECKQYLTYSLMKVGFELSIGEKTIAVLNYLLDNFSTGQIYSIIYSSINGAVRFYHEKRVNKKHAANSVITNMQRNGEKAITDANWVIRNYSRIPELPQSALSEVFYNQILQIGVKGFNNKPSYDFIPTTD
ncbi:hypothetical protein EEL31_10530 [Brevibacillus laterosporus]|nr:hypothetical protein EEL31_10530 [Brevibacillus laterosporus]